jgi:segregation and condensation protein B
MRMDALEAFDDTYDIKPQLEALLLVSTDPAPASDFARVLDVPVARVSAALEKLSREYAACGRGFQLREVAGGWRLFTHPAYHEIVEDYIRSWDTRRLSEAALEALAVIAYHQPCSREEVKAVRGVNSDSAISSLIDKGLVREAGRREGAGPILYATTQVFLERYGLKSLRDLPSLEQFAPDEQTRQLIRDRLSGTRTQATLDEIDTEVSDDELWSDDDDEPGQSADAHDPEDNAGHAGVQKDERFGEEAQ